MMNDRRAACFDEEKRSIPLLINKQISKQPSKLAFISFFVNILPHLFLKFTLWSDSPSTLFYYTILARGSANLAKVFKAASPMVWEDLAGLFGLRP